MGNAQKLIDALNRASDMLDLAIELKDYETAWHLQCIIDYLIIDVYVAKIKRLMADKEGEQE